MDEFRNEGNVLKGREGVIPKQSIVVLVDKMTYLLLAVFLLHNLVQIKVEVVPLDVLAVHLFESLKLDLFIPISDPSMGFCPSRVN